MRKQIQEAEQILKKEGPRAAQSTTTSHPAAVSLNPKLLIETSRIASLEARSSSLLERQQRLVRELEALNRQEGRLSELSESVALLRGNHREYAEKLEQARIDEALGEQRISNVNVVQPPTFVTKPVSPRKRLIVLLGVIVAAIASAGIALLTEYRQKSREQESADPNPARRTVTADNVFQEADAAGLHDEEREVEILNSSRN